MPRRPTERTVLVGVKIPVALHAELVQRAHSLDLTLSQFVRRAIRELLAATESADDPAA